MSDLKICRICLRKDAKVYNYNQYNLDEYYEQVLASNVYNKDELPQYFCYICAAMLHKFHKFRETCHIGQSILQQLLCRGPVTLTSISEIDRQSKNLKSPIEIVHLSEGDEIHHVQSTSLLKNVSNDDINNSLDNVNVRVNELDIKKENMDEEHLKVENNDSVVEEKALSDSAEDRLTEYDDMDSGRITNIDKIDIDHEKFTKESFAHTENLTDITETVMGDDKQIDFDNHTENTFEEKTEVPVKKNGRKIKDTEKQWNYLDPLHWLKYTLSEEEAVKEFIARASNPKYVLAPYKCTDCLKGFSKEDILTRHNLLKHGEDAGKIKCPFCNMRFKRNCFLTKHMPQHYDRYKCLRCDLVCPLEMTASLHNDFHNGVIRTCIHCGDEFRHLSTYYTHLRTHRSEHVCTLCGASFVSNIGLRRHKKVKHVIETKPEEEVDTYCERCDIKFDTRQAYKEHFVHSNKHAEGVEDLASETPASTIPKRRKISVRNPRLFTTCGICDMRFTAYAAYIRHHKAEHKDEPIPGENQRVICQICGVSLKPNSVTTHLNTHTRQTTYPCPLCGKHFNVKASMERHQLVHTKEKPFKCDLCDTRFTQKGSLSLHHRTIHLKQPIPKRNRRKLPDNPDEIPILEEYTMKKENMTTRRRRCRQ